MNVTLSNGLTIPAVGMGTSANTEPEGIAVLKQLVREGVYRHIDTASMYGNEEQIGQILSELIQEKSIERKDVFLTTKVFVTEMDDIPGALKRSLERLRVDYVDLYLVHWPIQTNGSLREPSTKLARVPMHKIWAQMESFVDQGLVKSIGVSNFNFQLLNDLLSYARIKPVCNQIELHPYLVQHDLVEWLKENQIVPVAYAPLARNSGDTEDRFPLIDPLVAQIGQKHQLTPGQVILAWHRARGHVIIPKSSNYERAKQNAQVVNLKLSPEEVDSITALDQGKRVFHPKRWAGDMSRLPMFQ